MDRNVPSPALETVARPAAHGGVMYVGPSLTRSLLGVVVALSRGSAEPLARIARRAGGSVRVAP